MRDARPWGWYTFLALDFIALVVGPMALFLVQRPGTDPAALPWTAQVSLMRIPLLGTASLIALVALLYRRAWGRWLLLATATLKYGLDLVIGGLAFGMLPAGLSRAYLLVRPLLLLGVNWVYLTHRAVKQYLR